MKKMLNFACVFAALMLVASCASRPAYTSSSPMMYVGPSKGWQKSGVDGKEAYETWQRCIEDAKREPGYLEAKRISDNVPQIERINERTKADRARMSAPGVFVGRYSDDCMKRRGFTYGRYTSPEQTYRPPQPPRKGWFKQGAPQEEVGRWRRRCGDEADQRTAEYMEARENGTLSVYAQSRINACMEAQGFTYGVLETVE